MAIYHSWDGTVLTITTDSGTSSADLQGEMGVRGPQGIPGPKGADGNVHFEELTEEQIAQLKGEKGDIGPKGSQGKPGASIWHATLSYEELGSEIDERDIRVVLDKYPDVGDLVICSDNILIRLIGEGEYENGYAFELLGSIQGEQGEAGESGVYIGEQAPEEEDINVWIEPDGTATAPDAFATKQYVDNLFNSIINGEEVAY